MQNHLSILRSCPFFTGLNEDEILSILHCVQAVEIARQRGAYIFRAGDSTEVMGLVLVRYHPCDTRGSLGAPQHLMPSAAPGIFLASLTLPLRALF